MSTVSTTSASERTALAFYATLPVLVETTQTFAPHLPIHYRDGSGVVQEGRPDALCMQSKTYTFIESKNGVLNGHHDEASSYWALQQEYALRVRGRIDQPCNVLASHFQRTNPVYLHDNAWNQSLYKILALQAEHGWQRYIVCFKKNPSKRDATRYAEAGWVFYTEKTLADMLQTIELAQLGFFVPFVLKTRIYGYSVTPDHTDKGRAVDDVRASDRTKFENAITTSMADAVSPDAF
jgi:hypothetical protein